MKPVLQFFIFLMFYITAAGQYVPLDARIKNNLYITVSVNKSEVYVGEPIVATYKLYSALESVSTIVRNPLFRGFSYKDLITPRDNPVSREEIDGIKFDVHTIKKVQLTPNQPGKLEADALTMANKIRVLDAQGNRLGLLNGVKENFTLDGNYIHFTISSVPITIHVLQPPATNRPVQYTGATGAFGMGVQLSKNTLAPGEEGLLTITISGKGNFEQVQMPSIQWPAGIRLSPVRTQNRYAGSSRSRVFSVGFSSDLEGSYTIMPIQFTYFDTVTKRLNTITNRPFTFYVRAAARRNIAASPQAKEIPGSGAARNALIIGGGLVLALLLAMIFINKRTKERGQKTPPLVSVKRKERPIDKRASDYLSAASGALAQEGNLFYNHLKQGLVHFFEDRFALPAALFNRSSLRQAFDDHGVGAPLAEETLNLLTEIEMNIYSGGGLNDDKAGLLQKATKLLNKM